MSELDSFFQDTSNLSMQQYKSKLAMMIPYVLMKVIYNNDNSTACSIFDCEIENIASFSDLQDLVKKIVMYSLLDYTTVLYGVALVDKYCKYTRTVLTCLNVVRIFVISVFISSKFLEDNPIKLIRLSNLIGVNHSDFIFLENEFLERMDYNIIIQSDVIQKYFKCLIC